MAGEPYFAGTGLRATVFWATFAAWFVYVTWLLRRERAGDDDVSTSRVLLLCTAGALGLGFAASYLITGAAMGGAVVFAVGLVLAWSGIALGEWGRRALGRHYHPVVSIDDDHTVITSGPYRLIRHPIYAGRLLSLFGLGLAMTNWVSLASCLILPLYGFALRISVEERAMLGATGDEYATYRDRTWRLVPRVW